MEIYELEPETNLKMKEEKEKQQNSKFNFHILSLNKNDFEITLELEEESIIIYANCQEKNKNTKIYYKEEFTIQYLRKIFEDNCTIDKYFYEIKNSISTSEKNCIINELKNKIEIIININSQIKKEMSFILKKKEKSVEEKIGELYDLINNLYKEKEEQKKEIDTLKEKLETFINQEIHIIGAEGKQKGSSFKISAFNELKFKDLINKDLTNDKFYVKILIKFDSNNNNELLKVLEFELEKFNKENRIAYFKNNFIIFEGNSQFNPELFQLDNPEMSSNLVKNFFNFNDLLNININFKTDLSIKNILEIKSSKEIFNIFFKLKMIIKGLTLNSKLWLKTLIQEMVNHYKLDNLIEELKMKQFYNYLIVALNNRITQLCLEERLLNDIYENTKFNDDKFMQMKNKLKEKLNFCENINELKILNAIDFENILIYIIIPGWKIGFKIELNFDSLNEVLKEQFLYKKKLEEKKEMEPVKEEKKKEIDMFIEKGKNNKISHKSKTTIQQKKKIKEVGKKEIKEIKEELIIDDKYLGIINEFRKDFNLYEKDYSNSYLLKMLLKNNFVKERAFEEIFS